MLFSVQKKYRNHLRHLAPILIYRKLCKYAKCIILIYAYHDMGSLYWLQSFSYHLPLLPGRRLPVLLNAAQRDQHKGKRRAYCPHHIQPVP